MKLVSLCIVLALTASALATTKSREQQKEELLAQLNAPNADVLSHPLGRIVTNLLQINEDPEWNKVFDALDLLEESLNERISAADEEFRNEENRHRVMEEEYKHFILSAENEISETKLQLQNHYYNDRNDLEASLENDEKEVDDSLEKLQHSEWARNADHDKWGLNDKMLTEIIEAIDEAIDLSEQLRDGDVSLVEVKTFSDTHAQKLHVVKEKLDKAGKNTWVPMIDSLLELATAGDFETRQMYTQVIGLLNDLRAKVVADQQAQEEFENKEAEIFKQLVANTESNVARLKAAITENTEKLAEVMNQIDLLESWIEKRESDRDDLEESLEDEVELWRQTKVDNERFNDEISEELRVIKECRTILQRNGLRRTNDEE